MKQNQKGISMVSLVITIAIAIGGAGEIVRRTDISDDASKTEPVVSENSILSVAKVGDYVEYSSNGVNSWRVFDIVSGEVLITPTTGPVGNLELMNVDGYVNAVRKIENECDVYTNSSLGITSSEVRSMSVEDINRAAGYIPEESAEKYAYFLNNDSMYDSTTLEYSGYTKIKHTSELEQGWSTPRFYTWDYAENITQDENGNKYAYPTNGKPVYITSDFYYYNPSAYKHVENDMITVGSLLGDNDGWLTSICTTKGYLARHAFDVRYTCSGSVYAIAPITSDGYYYGGTFGVRPLVSLKSEIQATGEGTIDSPWVLSK